MAEQTSRRSLDFHDFDAVLRDVDSLAAGGYDRAGKWDLSQTCKHLADRMRFPLAAFPKPPLPRRLLLGRVRTTIGPRAMRKTLERRSMPSGNPTLRETVPSPGGDATAAIDELRRVVTRFQNHTGPFHPSPLVGEIDTETWRQLQLIHCAHHLSFLIPRDR